MQQMSIWKVFVVASMLAYSPANARHLGGNAVNGACGSAEGVSTTSAPTTNLCSAGTATAISDIGGSWSWSCVGRKGGSTASCSAPLQQSGGSGSGGGGSGTGSSSGSGSSASAQVPGPSAALFDSPYYQCVTNYYVSDSGNDSANGSQATPWKTLQHADDMNVGAGSCINVAAGTYDGFLIAHGGNAASATGYVTYRCQQMDACIVRGNGGGNGSEAFDTVRTTDGTPPNYLQIDGFEMVGVGTGYPVGVQVYNGDNSSKVAGHHVWVLNSIVHGFGQSGISLCCAEYHYVIHNTAYTNSNTQCDAQGSGIAINTEHTVPGYTPTADDQTNPNPLLGPTWQVGNSFFHNVVEYNVTYNDAITQCNPPGSGGNTDGNGIIFDTNSGFAGNTTNYNAPMLAAFNVTYNNGGGGVHVFRSSNVTIANNSCFNNYLDPANSGSSRPCIDESEGSGSTIINNIAVAIPTTVSNCQYGVVPFTQWNNSIIGSPQNGQAADTFSNNLTDTIGVSCQGEVALFSSDTSYPASNMQSTTPGWVNVGTSSVGTESTPPNGVNFALAPGSKAIGAGMTEPYLPASSVDIGACSSSLTSCP
jgi:hypothetical protein